MQTEMEKGDNAKVMAVLFLSCLRECTHKYHKCLPLPESVYVFPYVWCGPLHFCSTLSSLLSNVPGLSYCKDVGSFTLCSVVQLFGMRLSL